MFRLVISSVALATGLTSMSVATQSSSAAAAAAQVTIQLSKRTITLGSKATVSGRGPALRSVFLELKTGDNGWQVLGRATTGLDGGYAIAAPAWYGVHRLRARVLATVLAPELVSATRTLRVKTSYRPLGRSSDWTPLGDHDARWDPCETITYAVNTKGGYPKARDDLAAAFNKLSKVTGFSFRSLGTTTVEVKRGRHGYHPPDTDIVIDWQGPDEEPGLADNVAGIGGNWVLAGRRFDGWVLLDHTARLDRGRWVQVMTHELGHVLGLGHATAPTQVMYGSSSDRNRRWGAGDLLGLWHLGASQGCLS